MDKRQYLGTQWRGQRRRTQFDLLSRELRPPERVFFGQLKHVENNSLPDLDLRERVALWPAAVLALVMGVAPLWWLKAIDPAVHNVLADIPQLTAKVVGQ